MAKEPVKRRYNTDTNQWEVVKLRTGPTPASNTRKKMRLAAAAAASKKAEPAKKAAPAKPAAKTAPVPKKRPAKKPAGARPEGPAAGMPVAPAAAPTGPKGRGGKRGTPTSTGPARKDTPQMAGRGITRSGLNANMKSRDSGYGGVYNMSNAGPLDALAAIFGNRKKAKLSK